MTCKVFPLESDAAPDQASRHHAQLLSRTFPYRHCFLCSIEPTAGIIFVIDSSDEFRMVSVKYELEQMLQHEGAIPNPCIHSFTTCSCHTHLISLSVSLQLFTRSPAAIAPNAHIPILFFANKMDLPKALGAAEISDRLELPKLVANREFRIVYDSRGSLLLIPSVVPAIFKFESHLCLITDF
jgi:hypothetical protein